MRKGIKLTPIRSPDKFVDEGVLDELERESFFKKVAERSAGK